MLKVMVILMAAAGCVAQSRYDAAVRDAEQAKLAATETNEQATRRLEATSAEIARLSSALSERENALQQRDQQVSDGRVTTHNLQARLDEIVAVNQQLRDELTRLGKNVDQLLGSTRSLDELKARLERLRKTEQAAEARRLTLQRLTLQLKPLSDAGFLSVGAREQTVVVAVPNDKLFEGPRQEIRATGEAVLKQIAIVLKTYPDRRFEVRARTDKDASAVRAIDITRRLVVLGVRPDALSATSWAERGRVEIALVPQPDELAP